MDVNRPQTKSQRSRKGKKAWRKNVDIDDVEKGLVQKSEHETLFGKNDASDDFILDTEGDVKLTQKVNQKKLKLTEILSKRSQYPALESARHSHKIQGVSKRDVNRLMKLSGRVQGTTAAQERVAQDGIIKGKATDLWGADEEELKRKQESIPDFLKSHSSTEWTKAKRQPKTLTEAPLSTNKTTNIINSGKSYNPSLESWKALINEEFVKESSNEEKRLLLKEHQERIQYLIANLEDNEEASDSEDEAKNEEKVEEIKANEEGDVEEESDKYKLSINKPTQVRIKTKTKRNREKKHKERQDLQAKLKELKTQIHELEKLEIYEEEVEEKLASIKPKAVKAPKKLFKYTNLNEQLEVKLSDEISDSLRKLRPEGNLLYDEMRKLQDSGKVEARIPVAKKRKYSPKITEKWTYKDFK